MGVTKEAVIVNKDKHELMTLSPEFDPQVREVVLETRFGPDDKYHRPINEEKFLDILGQRVGLVVRDGEIIPVIVGLNRPLVLKKPLGRGIRESVPTKDEQRAIEEINQLTAAHLKINFQATVAEKVLALEQMADQLPGPLKDFKLDAKTRKRLQGDAQRTGLIPVNQMLTDLAAMELEPVAGTGVNYEDTPVDIILDKVSNKIAKFFPSRIKMVGEAAPTGQKDRDLPESPASGGGSKRISFPAKTGDVVFDRQMRTVKTVLISSSVLAGTAIFLAFCGSRIINAIDGTPVDVEPTQVYLPTPTEQPLPTPDISIVAGMETPTAESTVEAPTQEIGQPTVWTPPTFEQLTAKGGPVPEDTNKKMDDLKQAVEGRISGATAYHPLWNGGYADDTRIQIYGSNQEGIIWQVNADGSFNEYPVTVAADPQTVFKFMEGQKFELIEGSENAFVVFTGAGAGEKLAVVRNEIVLADGKTKVCLEYLNFQTKEWEINPNVLAAMLPEGSQNNLIWQDENGQWLAGQAGTEQAILQFDLAKKAWVEALPPLPSEFLAQFPSGQGYEIRDGAVYAPDATGQERVWYQQAEDGSWQELYFRYGEPLTEEKKVELAQQVPCRGNANWGGEGSCIQPYHDYPANAFDFQCISTGIVEKHPYLDPYTGLEVGEQFDLLTVSRNINGNPITARIAVQVELDSQPNINQFYSLVGFLQGYAWKQEPKDVISLGDLAQLFKQGKTFNFSIIFKKIQFPNLSPENTVVYPNLDNSGYYQFLEEFNSQRGFDTKGQTIFYSGYSRK